MEETNLLIEALNMPEVRDWINQTIEEKTSELSQRVAKLENERAAEMHSDEGSKVQEKIGNLGQQVATLQRQLDQKIPEARREGVKMGEISRKAVERVLDDLDKAAESLGFTDDWLRISDEAGFHRGKAKEKQEETGPKELILDW